MGACGCCEGNEVFKLKAPKGYYVIELMSGCDYCCVGPGLSIHHPEAIDPMYFGFESLKDMVDMPDLPVIGKGEHCLSMIKCGLDPDEAKTAAIDNFAGTSVNLEVDDKIDDILAEILGEDLWKNALLKAPSVIYPRKNDEEEN